jgi:DNA polymerase-1
MSRFAADIAEAEQQAPMSNGPVTVIPGRLLLADGDGLCYYCAGKDDTEPGLARANLIDKLRSAARASGAEAIKVVTTSRGCHKGFRYAVARVKPYQGQRTDQRRPRNWEFLRGLLERGDLGPGIEVEFTDVAEADDLFSRYALTHPDCVIYTQDKDMRMVPGWHLDWLTHLMFKLEAGTWAVTHNEKLWGRAWFWSQMLHGDGADNIPGLPWYTTGELLKSGPKKGEIKQIPCGEKSTAVIEMLPNVGSDMGALCLLKGLYETCYGDRWAVEMLEQGILLWMRNDTASSALNVTAAGNPLAALTTHELYPAARAEIMARIAEAVVHAETQSVGHSDDPDITLDIPGQSVRDVPATLLGEPSSVGPQSLVGSGEGDGTPGVQRPVGEDREQPQAVRRAQPSSVAAWASGLLAKA